MTNELKKRLEQPGTSGVYRIVAPEALELAAKEAGLAASHLALNGAADKQALLRAVAAALDFPDWFGENWDALEDCLTDLSWRPGGSHLLLIDGHARLPSDVSRIFVEILGSAAERWASSGERFFAVFIDPQHALALPEIGR